MKLSSLSDTELEIAFKRFSIINPCLENRVSVPTIARTKNISIRTIHRWLSQYRKKGLVGLVRYRRSDSGFLRDIPDELIYVIEGLALQKPPPSISYVYRQACDIAQRQGWKIPTYQCVYRIVKKLDPGLLMLAHKGSKAYRLAYDLLHRREAGVSNEIWQADHTLLDIWIKQEGGGVIRPWLSIIIDDYSRAIAGYRLSILEPSAIQTALVLRQAIWQKPDPQWHICGIPSIFYTDHGSDFTSLHLEQVSADLKIQLIFSEAGMPRGRGRVERFFSTVNQMLLCSLPGYTRAGKPVEKKLLTLSTLESCLKEFILNNYHKRKHSETGIAPQSRWESDGFLPQMPESLEQLDLLLLTVPKSRKVRQDGIRFQGFRYMDLTLAAYIGESVIIRYDPLDMAEIRVFHKNKFICKAICHELAGEVIALRDIIKARNQRRTSLRQTLKERSRLVESLLEAHRGDLAIEDFSSHNDRKAITQEDHTHEYKQPLKRYRSE